MWEGLGMFAVYASIVFMAGCNAFFAVNIIFKKQLDRMELAGLIPPLIAMFAVWGAGIAAGLIWIGTMIQ